MTELGRLFSRVTIGQVVSLAFGLRLLWALLVPAHPISDSSVYDELALRLAQGHGYTWADGTPTAIWPVGTSAFYALIYWAFGHNLLIAALINVLIGTALVYAIHCLAATRFEPRIAILAALIAAVWPTWISMTSVVASDLPSNLLLITALVCALSDKGPALGRVVLSSVLLVGATYFRANYSPLIVIVPALVALQKRKPAQMVTHAALALLIGTVLIAPWTYRNYKAFGEIVPVSANLGMNLWMANNPRAYGGYMPSPKLPGGAQLPENEALRDKMFSKHAMDYIREHPVHYLELCLRRIGITIQRETFGVAWNAEGLPEAAHLPLKALMSGFWYAVLPLSLGGLALFLRRRPVEVLSPLVAVPAIVLAPAVVVLGSERYHYGAAPFMAIFAAYALVSLERAIAAKRTDTTSMVSA